MLKSVYAERNREWFIWWAWVNELGQRGIVKSWEQQQTGSYGELWSSTSGRGTAQKRSRFFFFVIFIVFVYKKI